MNIFFVCLFTYMHCASGVIEHGHVFLNNFGGGAINTFNPAEWLHAIMTSQL